MGNEQKSIVPAQIPVKGFYKKWKHKYNRPADPPGKNVYQVLGIAGKKNGPWMVVYRPLDPEAPVYQWGKLWDYKSVDEFLGEVLDQDGKMVPNYTKVESLTECLKFGTILQELYGNEGMVPDEPELDYVESL